MAEKIKKIYTGKNVYDTAIDRIRWLMEDFGRNFIVGFSGGKDSTVVLNLSLKVAEEMNLLPLKVLFIDQEAEWKATIDYVDSVMRDKRIEPIWLQIPMFMSNNAVAAGGMHKIWDEDKTDEEFIHPRVDISIKENVFGENRFHKMFKAVSSYYFKEERGVTVSGVRTEESIHRFMALTGVEVYKGETWGNVHDKKREHYTMYPIYDWKTSDVWHFISKFNIKYNRMYDKFYAYGLPKNKMRVSSLHHEIAVQGLTTIQELEPKTWDKLRKRVYGVNTVKQLKEFSYNIPHELPSEFSSWEEFAIYLAAVMLDEKDEVMKMKIIRMIEKTREFLVTRTAMFDFYRQVINAIIVHDDDLIKVGAFYNSPTFLSLKNYIKTGDYKPEYSQYNKYVDELRKGN